MAQKKKERVVYAALEPDVPSTVVTLMTMPYTHNGVQYPPRHRVRSMNAQGQFVIPADSEDYDAEIKALDRFAQRYPVAKVTGNADLDEGVDYRAPRRAGTGSLEAAQAAAENSDIIRELEDEGKQKDDMIASLQERLAELEAKGGKK